jgi:hypothetical protein
MFANWGRTDRCGHSAVNEPMHCYIWLHLQRMQRLD